MYGCLNPFAPSLDEEPNNEGFLISDQKNIEGVFQNFKYAYAFKDTTIYGALLNEDFIFSYHDYDANFDQSWGRSEEMRTTYGLFQNTQNLDLIWNSIDLLTIDSTSVRRSFNLTITFGPSDVFFVSGKVYLTLVKNPATQQWKISRWLDESN